MYDYLNAMVSDVTDYIKSEINVSDYSNRDELKNALNNDLWTVDSVTGNGSGSYTFDHWDAAEYVNDNIDLLADACAEFCIDDATVGKKFLEEDFEYFDVTIRCYLLSAAISAALDEMNINDDTFKVTE